MGKGYITATFPNAVLFGIVIVGVAFILVQSMPIIESSTSSTKLKNAENIMRTLDNSIMEVAQEGGNASRLVTFTTPDEFVVLDNEDAIEFRIRSSAETGIDYFARIIRNNLVFISGNDVSCTESDANNDGNKDLVLENSFLKAAFQSVKRTQPLSQLDTSYNIIQITEKIDYNSVTFANTSLVIDDNSSTSYGTGFSEILMPGKALPECTVHFFVDSGVKYDIYYKLYAGADFLAIEVRNIRNK